MSWRVGVVVPARDEEERIGACLAAVDVAIRAAGVPAVVCVVADRCTDATAERALAEARAAERAYGPGGTPGPLAGIPTSVKDNQPVRGIRMTGGSLATKDFVPDQDAIFVTRLSAAGMTLLGKTKPVTIPATVAAGDTLTISSEFKINRADWGMTYGKGMVDDTVSLKLNVGAKK